MKIGQKLAILWRHPTYGGAGRFVSFIRSEYSRWGEIVKATGIKVD